MCVYVLSAITHECMLANLHCCITSMRAERHNACPFHHAGLFDGLLDGQSHLEALLGIEWEPRSQGPPSPGLPQPGLAAAGEQLGPPVTEGTRRFCLLRLSLEGEYRIARVSKLWVIGQLCTHTRISLVSQSVDLVTLPAVLFDVHI